MKTKIPVTLLILCEFVICFTLIALLYVRADNAEIVTFIVEIVLPAFVLLLAIVFTIRHCKTEEQRRVATLEMELNTERSENISAQTQFDETIEQRTFELQRVNGALNREIAERIQVEEEVRELQKQSDLILDSAGEGILGLDNQGRVIFVNQAALFMLGWEKEELLGNTHHELIHHTNSDGSHHPVEQCPIYKAYKDGKVHYRTGDVFWCKNGTSFPVEYVSTPIRDRGMLTGAVVVFRDMNTYK